MRNRIDRIRDTRKKPQIRTSTIFGAAIVMKASRLGSLNALEKRKEYTFWKRWLGEKPASADRIGDVYTEINLTDIRREIKEVYSKLKRNKVLPDVLDSSMLLVDGHETYCSYLRDCAGCLQRTIHTKNGDRIQYYHRHVLGMLLVAGKFPILLDIEEQRKGEDEVAAGIRLVKRILKNYPRAFKIIAGDGLYLRSNFFELALSHGKEAIAVLKDERRDLIQDARGLFRNQKPKIKKTKNKKIQMWDIEGFQSWETFNKEIRVVRALETQTVRRQLTGEKEKRTSEWMWATTLKKDKAKTETVVEIGHNRWDIENKAFNEMVNTWHADHIYKHNSNAISGFWLTLMLALNLYRAFINLNIKPELRAKHTAIYFSELIFAELELYACCYERNPP